jgi:uncharacterized membrane protein
MAQEHIAARSDVAPAQPNIRTIGVDDLRDALAKGYVDFSAMPSHAVFLCLIYPILGLILAVLTFGYNLLPLLFPLLAGFALIGPLAALGLYELSRRREQGHDVSVSDAFAVLRSPRIGAIAVLGIMLVVIFLAWLVVAQTIYYALFGDTAPVSIAEFARQVFTTRAGWTLILVGNAVGFLFAVMVLMLSVVSFPLLLDRRVDAVTAASTSIRCVLANPITMAIWGLIVAGALVIGSLPLLLGLVVVLPVLGHATWHLYRKVIEPDPNSRFESRPGPDRPRYAADFPAVLFPGTRENR